MLRVLRVRQVSVEPSFRRRFPVHLHPRHWRHLRQPIPVACRSKCCVSCGLRYPPHAQTVTVSVAERLIEALSCGALVLGSEGHGLSARWQTSADRRAVIPMAAGIDSLNVAAASAVACYAAARR